MLRQGEKKTRPQGKKEFPTWEEQGQWWQLERTCAWVSFQCVRPTERDVLRARRPGFQPDTGLRKMVYALLDKAH